LRIGARAASHAALLSALRTLLAGRIAVIIARRLSTLDVADRVLVIDGGPDRPGRTPEELRGVADAFRRLNEEWAASLGA
jgi:ATP-binding cassette subfamily B protein